MYLFILFLRFRFPWEEDWLLGVSDSKRRLPPWEGSLLEPGFQGENSLGWGIWLYNIVGEFEIVT
jgi:hypothetical protein